MMLQLFPSWQYSESSASSSFHRGSKELCKNQRASYGGMSQGAQQSSKEMCLLHLQPGARPPALSQLGARPPALPGTVTGAHLCHWGLGITACTGAPLGRQHPDTKLQKCGAKCWSHMARQSRTAGLSTGDAVWSKPVDQPILP